MPTWQYSDYHNIDTHPTPRERYVQASRHLQELSEELHTERSSGPHAQSSNAITTRINAVEQYLRDMRAEHPSLRDGTGYQTRRAISRRA